MKLVVTVVGKDRVGIIATVSSVLAENNVNIISINQNIMNGFFNMVLIAEMNDKDIKLQDLQKVLKEKGAELKVDIKVQHEEIFNAMHTI
ncbi:ACT domain-containing protein [Megamonas hypermegale]|uniref:ACT domain-containing protein n=1 Tax=Megamonas hypermegale TaxID=158847 RepID=UPI0025A427E2|nr:ACT domain-containing protein [Megamonas hypermegale]MDM8142882.1 ACT domain-containing protein [Megamonas hypermegale]